MKNRFNRMFSLFCAITMLICAVSAWALAESPVATPTDLTPEEEEPAADVENIITKTIKINESWEGRMKKTKPAILKLDLDKAQTVYMLVEGRDVWATVEKSDQLTENPPRTRNNPETEQLIYRWEAEAGSYLITLGPVEPNLLAMAKVIFMDNQTFKAWKEEQKEIDPESETEKKVEPTGEENTEPEALPNSEEEPGTEEQTEVGNIEDKQELPADRNAVITLSWDVEKPTYGSIAHFKATLIGYEGLDYVVQWQWSKDGDNWIDVEAATSENLDVVYTQENGSYQWRIVVDVIPPTGS